jgi:hypothetical protein
MNHFGNRPSGSEWDRNNPDLIIKHAKAFVYGFKGRYPNFISLDYINWNIQNNGPILAIPSLQGKSDVNIVPFQWIGKNDFDTVLPEIYEKKISSLAVGKKDGQGIVSIMPQFFGSDSIRVIQLYNKPGYGIVNLRFQNGNQVWSNWQTRYETPNGNNDPNLANYVVPEGHELIGLCCRTQHKYGVTDFAIATRQVPPTI